MFQEQAAFLSERSAARIGFIVDYKFRKSSNSNSKKQHLGRRGLSVGHRSGTHHDCSFRLQWLVLWYGVPLPDFNSCSKGRQWRSLLQIEDAPRFGHRGFMLDLSRNYTPKEKILEILDYMAYYKLNLFDLKLSDDEGWRIEIPGLEELTEIGSKRGFTQDEKDRLLPMYGSGSGEKESQGSGYLTRTDFIEILQAATQRNIRVVPQISFPSHARAAVVAMKARYENLLEKGEVEAANEYRLHDPNDQSDYTSAQLFKDNTICICDPSAFRFFEKVFDEIKAMYTEADLPMKTYNIGADELPYGVWQKSPLCEDYINKI